MLSLRCQSKQLENSDAKTISAEFRIKINSPTEEVQFRSSLICVPREESSPSFKTALAKLSFESDRSASSVSKTVSYGEQKTNQSFLNTPTLIWRLILLAPHMISWQIRCSNIYQRNWWSLEARIHCRITPNHSQHLCYFSYDSPRYFPFKFFSRTAAALIAEIFLQVGKRIQITELKDYRIAYYFPPPPFGSFEKDYHSIYFHCNRGSL